jgi:hypothetical protein
MATWVWIVIVIVVVIVIGLVAAGARKRRTADLRGRFGPEYDRTVENHDGRLAAEADLRAREKERAQFDIEPLPEAARLQFADEWRVLQERFIDQPTQAAAGADILITRVMEAQGYPMKDFDAQADLVSVDHPDTVGNYRFAHAVQQRSQTQQASTEDLREALLRYRSLFDELLNPEGNGAAGATAADRARPASSGSRQRLATGPEAQALGATATGQAEGTEPRGSDGLAGPAASDTAYHNQQTGQ